VEVYNDKNSLLFWYPRIKELGIPTPKTRWVEFPPTIGRALIDRTEEAFNGFQPFFEAIQQMITDEFGYPVFIRTDVASGKHDWKNSCFIQKKADLMDHIVSVLEFNEMAGMLGLNYQAIVIRDFLELDWRFKAFHGEMPVARERRYFIRDGDVVCHHPYWIHEAIREAHQYDGIRSFFGYMPHKLPNTWEIMLSELNHESAEEIDVLTEYSRRVAAVVDGYWSVDYAYTRGGVWYLIDMALGEASWHPECDAT
jgi:hypothetical protein